MEEHETLLTRLKSLASMLQTHHSFLTQTN